MDSCIDWKEHDTEDVESSASQQYSFLASCEEEFSFMGFSSQVPNCVFGCDKKYNALKEAYDDMEPKYKDCYIQAQAFKEAVKTLEQQMVWFQQNQLAYDEKIRVLKRDLEMTSNELKFSEKEKAKVELELQELKVKFDNEVAGRMKWQQGSKHLDRIIDSCQSIKSRRALGYGGYVGPDEVYDPNDYSVLDPEPPLQFQTPVKYVKKGEMHTVSPTIT